MKDKKILFITGIVLLFLMTVGMSYAYFSLSVSGNADAKDMVVEAGTLRLTYTDSPEIIMQNIKPGQTITKKVTVKNTGTLDTAYNLVWQELYNKIGRNDLVMSYTCERFNSSGVVDGTCAGLTETPVKTKTITKNIPIESGVTHNYTITITFKETGENQNYNQGKSFSGVLGIEEYKDNTPSPIYCTFDGNMVQGAEYVNGQYTYRYKQEYQEDFTSETLSWVGIADDGWGVTLTDKTSTDAVTTTPCTYINDKPVISMSFMFIGSNASSIDLSKANTSNVTNMSGMFFNSQATTLDLSNFDTRNVTDMSGMFWSSQATTLDLSNFNTSKVIDMNGMFEYSEAITLDLSSFDTSKVTNMSGMFDDSKATTLDVSNFDTRNVTNMSSIFSYSQATTLDLSSFDTRNVTNMGSMFSYSRATTINLSSFDTSNVTDMSNMFSRFKATTLDLSNFDTRNVTNMGGMFYSSQATALDLSSFDTRNVTHMGAMFSGSKATTLDLSSFDTSNVTNMSSMFNDSVLTTIDVSNFNTNKVTNMSSMFSYSTNLKTIYTSNKFATASVTSSTNMFKDCTSLVGGQGTVYNENYVDKTYARIDGGTSSSGYFTSK